MNMVGLLKWLVLYKEKPKLRVNLIKLLQMQFTSVATVSEVEDNSHTCKLHL